MPSSQSALASRFSASASGPSSSSLRFVAAASVQSAPAAWAMACSASCRFCRVRLTGLCALVSTSGEKVTGGSSFRGAGVRARSVRRLVVVARRIAARIVGSGRAADSRGHCAALLSSTGGPSRQTTDRSYAATRGVRNESRRRAFFVKRSVKTGAFVSRGRLLLLVILIAVPLVAYGAASAVVWDKLTSVPTQCGGRWTENTPESFEAPEEYALDTRPWAMPSPEEVRIPSRDPNVEIAGWWLPATPAEGDGPAPAVIVVHGFTACRHDHAV